MVMTLMKPYLNKGHTLFLDNWYTDLLLFEELHVFKTGACGTVRKNRVGLPKFDKLVQENFDYRNTNTLMVLTWQDKRKVTMLFTIHESKMVRRNKVDWKTHDEIKKP